MMACWNVYAILVEKYEGNVCVKVGCTQDDLAIRMRTIGRFYDTRRTHKPVEYLILAETSDDSTVVDSNGNHASSIEQRVLSLLDDTALLCQEAWLGREGFTEVFIASTDNWRLLKQRLDGPDADDDVQDFVRQIFRSLFENGYLKLPEADGADEAYYADEEDE